MCARTPNLDALVLSNNSALFSRFYSAAGVCSPTRAAYLTGRTNERDCIHFALSCDQENPADQCSQGKGLPWSEFTTAHAAKVGERACGRGFGCGCRTHASNLSISCVGVCACVFVQVHNVCMYQCASAVAQRVCLVGELEKPKNK